MLSKIFKSHSGTECPILEYGFGTILTQLPFDQDFELWLNVIMVRFCGHLKWDHVLVTKTRIS